MLMLVDNDLGLIDGDGGLGGLGDGDEAGKASFHGGWIAQISISLDVAQVYDHTVTWWVDVADQVPYPRSILYYPIFPAVARW